MTDNRSPLTQWALDALGLPEVQVQVRLRGNHLHILCEGTPCPPVEVAVTQFSAALNDTDLKKLLPDNHPRIYQVFLCGRSLGRRRNDWTVRLDCSGGDDRKVPIAPPKAAVSQEPQPSFSGARAFGLHQAIAPRHALEEPSGTKEASELENLRQNGLEVRISAPAAAQVQAVRDRPLPAIAEHPVLTEAFQMSPITIDTTPAEFRGSTEVESLPQTSPATEPGSHNLSGLIRQGSPETSEFDCETDSPPNSETWRLTPDPSIPEVANSALTVSNESLARQGYPDAIASYLSEILGPLGVAVKISIRRRSPAGTAPALTEKRLLTLLESSYSPDPSLLAEPIAGRLRKLKLQEFRDAIVVSTVRGETKPDWMLRVDLTPPDRMLKEWARWGDLQAIALLLSQALQPAVEVRTTLKESTLHLFCSRTQTQEESGNPVDFSDAAPDKEATLKAIAPLLATLAPQGIRAATLYGVVAASTGTEAPAWIDWLDLPAAHHPDLAPSAWTLASQGDRSALSFLIDRLLNPELEQKLQTGGLRVILLVKDDLLHIMSEATTCPTQSKVGPPIAQLLRQLHIPTIAGVRIYGRRAGQKLPLWRYGVDFKHYSRQTATATAAKSLPATIQTVKFDQEPEFAPTTEIVDLPMTGDFVLYPDLEPTTARTEWPRPHQVGEKLIQAWQRSLIASGLFVPKVANSLRSEVGWSSQTAGIACCWTILAGLLAWGADLSIAQFLGSPTQGEGGAIAECFGPACSGSASGDARLPLETVSSTREDPLSFNPSPKKEETLKMPLQQTVASNEQIFNGSGFTKPGNASVTLVTNCRPGETLKGETCEPAPPPSYPSFRSEQLDEQLVRYQQYLQVEKKPPDILIVGSSRALRGIDPAVLEQSLAAQGHPGLKVYNFGVNGATIQVVDLIVRRLLPPDQLPKLIVLADGARAVNSGRVDVTYNAISSSEAYKQLVRGTFSLRPQAPATFQIRTNQLADDLKSKGSKNPLAAAAQGVEHLSATGKAAELWLQQKLPELSASYRQRDRLKALMRSTIPQLSTSSSDPSMTLGAKNGSQETAKKTEENGQLAAESSELSSNGFLPISLRFEPEKYYQKHPKVLGDYDSDYQGFQLEGQQTTAFKKLVDFTQTHNINVVFVNMPLTQDYLDPVRAKYEQEFRESMQELADQTGLIFLDIGELWPEGREYFSDPSHLNRYGAVAVSKQLAKEREIPWPKGN